MRRLSLILFLFATTLVASAAETNYICVVCGKGPLSGHIWISKWGAICNDCFQLETRCSLCGLPIRDGDGAVKTGDGRFICKFDKPDAILDLDAARQVFADTRRELQELYGSGFVLRFPDVTVNLFDVDYWSELGRSDGLHKFGFASTRTSAKGVCTHEVVMLSGRLRQELAATAAHEYTHLWINENRPKDRVIDPDTVEAICELSGYKLMAAHAQPGLQKRILENTYTHGQITNLVAIESSRGIGFVLNWVKNGTTTNFTEAAAPPLVAPVMKPTNGPPQLPTALKFTGLSVIGTDRMAIINGVAFAPGDQRRIKLRSQTVVVRCREIRADAVTLQIDNAPEPITLKLAGAE